MFGKKKPELKEQTGEFEDVDVGTGGGTDVQPDIIEDAKPVAASIVKDNKNAMISDLAREVSLTLRKEDYRSETTTHTTEELPEKVTRFIDIDERDEATGVFSTKKDDWDNPIELQGQLGNIPKTQMPYITLSNFNNIWTKLRDGVYLDVYELDENGNTALDDEDNPIIKYTKVVNVGVVHRTNVLRINLAVNENRVRRQAGVMIGVSGGNPMMMDGSWDDTVQLMFGGQKKQKQQRW
jgi:hypothetical protein